MCEREKHTDKRAPPPPTHALYCSAARPAKPQNSASSASCAALGPDARSTGILRMASGVASATSSMLVPPFGLATISGPCALRSSMMEK